jgi:hypothetical protein
MQIAAIELYHVSVPLKQTFWPTWIPGYPQTPNRLALVEPHAQARGTSTFFGGTRRSISAFVPIGLRWITLPSIHPRANPPFFVAGKPVAFCVGA